MSKIDAGYWAKYNEENKDKINARRRRLNKKRRKDSKALDKIRHVIEERDES